MTSKDLTYFLGLGIILLISLYTPYSQNYLITEKEKIKQNYENQLEQINQHLDSLKEKECIIEEKISKLSNLEMTLTVKHQIIMLKLNMIVEYSLVETRIKQITNEANELDGGLYHKANINKTFFYGLLALGSFLIIYSIKHDETTNI